MGHLYHGDVSHNQGVMFVSSILEASKVVIFFGFSVSWTQPAQIKRDNEDFSAI